MAALRTLEEGGIPVLDPSIRSEDVARGLEAKGVHIHEGTVSLFRHGKSSGGDTLKKIKAADILKRDDASKKDRFYLDVAGFGMDTRRVNNRYDRLSSSNFVSTLAEKFGVSIFTVDALLAAMRADMITSFQNGEDHLLAYSFVGVAERYLRDYSHGLNQSPGILNIKDRWVGYRKDLANFYQLFSEHAQAPGTSRTWRPYEVEAFEGFYRRRIRLGSELSAFDVKTLDVKLNDVPLRLYTRDLKSTLGIIFDREAHEVHLKALIE